MLPGAASAAPNLANYGQCHKVGILDGGWRQNGVFPANTDEDLVGRGPSFSNGRWEGGVLAFGCTHV